MQAQTIFHYPCLPFNLGDNGDIAAGHKFEEGKHANITNVTPSRMYHRKEKSMNKKPSNNSIAT